jgi:CDP-glycerol glycerophosphotransferase
LWATLFLHAANATHAIWQHNDMSAEQERIIGGRPRLRRSLGAVFSLYSQFDSIVAVSRSLCELNRQNLAKPYGIAPSAFVSARNLVDEQRVIRESQVPLEQVVLRDDVGAEPTGSIGWIEELSVQNDTRWFVTLGRFSTEKNQARLIRAFAQVNRRFPYTRLLLVGYGPLRSHLSDLIHELDLSAVAHVTGPYANPFPVLRAADCFVLSSEHEGQPMVILEAAIIGLPIVSTNFISIRDAIPDSVIRITEQTDDALAGGMMDFVQRKVVPQHLDAARYTKTVLDEVIRALQHVHAETEDVGVPPVPLPPAQTMM